MSIIDYENIKPNFNLGIVVSRFNEEVTTALWDGAKARCLELGFHDSQLTTVWVPGAVEIPLIAKRLALSDRFEAIICLGAVIRGETGHYDHVCQQVSLGTQQVGLETEVPVIFGVLTTDNEEQALERAGGNAGHKGREAVDAAMHMVSVLRKIDEME